MARRVRGCRLSVMLVAALLAGCGGGGGTPTRLMDGSPTREVPVELESVESPLVLTAVHVTDVLDVKSDSSVGSCLSGPHRGVRAAAPAVARVGVSSETVTFRSAARRSLYGCDNSPGSREGNRRWCGGASGRLYGGRLRDPRLDIICETRDGKKMGFVWVQPFGNTRYVVVEQPGYAEVYEVAGGLPVRVSTTTGASTADSKAVFDLSEHDAQGRRIRRYELVARVAG